MATASQGRNLKDEATCSICLEYFTDPVSTDCEHIFCRSCITQSWEGRDGNSPCPQCREISPGRSLRPNRQLGNIVEMLKQLHLPPVEPPQENLCQKHEEKLRLFCDEDQRMICVVCRESKAHKSHSVSPIEEAAEEYKVKLRDWLGALKREMGCALESKHKEEEQCKALRNTVEAEEKQMASEIEELRQLLREREETLQGRLKEMDKKITLIGNVNIAKLSNQITSLKALIMEIEKKCEEPAWELLQDVNSTMSRCNKVTLHIPQQKKKAPKNKKKKHKIPRFQRPGEEIKKYKVMVTLDPDTAHCELILSEDNRHVREADTLQPLPDTPKRFTSARCVLGKEGFTSGRHYWEVQLLNDCGVWIVGVAAETMNRNGGISWSPEGGVWALQGRVRCYHALTTPQTPLYPHEEFQKLGVYLDYEGGRLSLYNGDSMEHLYTFPHASFKHRLFLIFYISDGVMLRMV